MNRYDVIVYLATAFLTHQLASLIQIAAHLYLGHVRRGYLRTVHSQEHHGIYSRERLVSNTYLDESRSVDSYYAVPAAILLVAAYLALPWGVFVVHALALAASIAAHVYLHVQYHIRSSWLNLFRWFRRKRQLHLYHHKDTTRNYAVIEFFWDRVFGTYHEARPERPRLRHAA